MGQHAQEALAGLGLVVARPHGRAQDSFVLTDGALDLPPLAVDAPVEPTRHLCPVTSRRRRVRPALIDGDDRRADPELLPAEGMVVLGVVASVGQQAVEADVPGRLPHGLGELRRVVARAARGHRTGQKVRGVVADHGELRPVLAASQAPAAAQVVDAGLMGFQPCGVDGGLGAVLDQAAAAGGSKDGAQEGIESPLFSRRFSA